MFLAGSIAYPVITCGHPNSKHACVVLKIFFHKLLIALTFDIILNEYQGIEKPIITQKEEGIL